MQCSLIVCTFNEEHHIGRFLEGVRHQTVQDVEVILVDSGSIDATATIAAQYSATVLYIPPAFSGPDSTILGHVPGLPPVTGKELAVTGNIYLHGMKMPQKPQPRAVEPIRYNKRAMSKLAALVPMRHHSQRVQGKNYRPLAGKPLYQHIIETLLDVSEINAIVVDTDSQPVIEGLRRDFPQVRIINRPEHLRFDTISMNEILLYDTSQVEADFYLQTHSTNPLLRPATISKAIQTFLADFPKHDSLFSVTRLQARLYDRHGQALNHDPNILLQTQDLPPVYEENSCIYIFNHESLSRRSNRLGEKPLMFEIDAAEAWDIDEELDFTIADFLMKQRAK